MKTITQNELMHITSCLMSEKLHKYQKKEIADILKDVCSFYIASGNNPFFDCSLNGDYNEAFRIVKYVSMFRPVLFASKQLKNVKMFFKGKCVYRFD